MKLKKIELNLYFDDDFMPPEKFECPCRENHWDSKCASCPFYGWDDENGDRWCNIACDVSNGEICPIRRFFETDEKEELN